MEDDAVAAAAADVDAVGRRRFREDWTLANLDCPLCLTDFENLDVVTLLDGPALGWDALAVASPRFPGSASRCCSSLRRTISFRLRFSNSNLSLARLPISFTFSSRTIFTWLELRRWWDVQRCA